MNEIISYLAGPIVAIIASLIFFWIARRESTKTAAFVAQLEERSRLKVDEHVRRIEGLLRLAKQDRDDSKV